MPLPEPFCISLRKGMCGYAAGHAPSTSARPSTPVVKGGCSILPALGLFFARK